MNLGKTLMGHMFKKSNKIVNKDNVGVNNKYISLLKKDLLKKIFFLTHAKIYISDKKKFARFLVYFYQVNLFK